MPQEGHPGDRELRHAISAVDDGSGEDAATEVGDVLDVHFALVPMGRVNGDRGGYWGSFIPSPPPKKKTRIWELRGAEDHTNMRFNDVKSTYDICGNFQESNSHQNYGL